MEGGQWMLPMEYNYLTEFQAHTPDFDYLKSIEIAEKINSISWLQGTHTSHMLLSANDKQAKLWKVCIMCQRVHWLALFVHHVAGAKCHLFWTALWTTLSHGMRSV